MKNPFVELQWDKKLRAWLPGYTKLAYILMLALGFASVGAITQISLTTQVKGVLPEGNGGTNQSTYTLGDVLYATGSNTLGKLSGQITTTNKFLSQTGTGAVSAAPVWSALIAGDIPSLDTSKLTTGTMATARLGSGSATGSTFLRGDSTWATVPASLTTVANETPAGTINGVNATFTTANNCTYLYLFKNGQRMTPGASADYQYATNTITMSSGAKPLTGDVLLDDCEY